MGLIDSVNNLSNVYISERQKRKQEQEEKQNKKIRQNNYKLELQQYFYNEFKKQHNTEKTKKYFNTLENRLRTIGNISKNKEDEFATRELNLLYDKELNFIYNIFKQDAEATGLNIENQIYTGIQQTYKKHGLNAFYKLQDVKYQFLNQYNINCQKYDFYFDKINKHFFKYYKSIQEEEKQTNNIFYYILAILTGGLIRRNCWSQRNKNKKKQMEVLKMNKIELVKDFYGFTTNEAKNYLKDASENQIKEIQNYFINNSKKSFYND